MGEGRETRRVEGERGEEVGERGGERVREEMSNTVRHVMTRSLPCCHSHRQWYLQRREELAVDEGGLSVPHTRCHVTGHTEIRVLYVHEVRTILMKFSKETAKGMKNNIKILSRTIF